MSAEPLEMNSHQTAESDPSDSAAQREVDAAVLDRLDRQHPGWRRVDSKTTSAELGLAPVWQNARPDAVWITENHEIAVAECYLRVDELKSGHQRKLAMGALKLLALRHALLPGSHVRSLLVVPEDLIVRLKGGGWFPVALQLAAEIIPMTLLESGRQKLGAAVTLHAQGQARTMKAGKGRTE